jgi:hypothetical protein
MAVGENAKQCSSKILLTDRLNERVMLELCLKQCVGFSGSQEPLP